MDKPVADTGRGKLATGKPDALSWTVTSGVVIGCSGTESLVHVSSRLLSDSTAADLLVIFDGRTSMITFGKWCPLGVSI